MVLTKKKKMMLVKRMRKMFKIIWLKNNLKEIYSC